MNDREVLEQVLDELNDIDIFKVTVFAKTLLTIENEQKTGA